ncbi:MAG: hypothetical protein A3J76_03895 [Candidatus Moranbacteria bacterium RBG_13_45_13]|nr:MAG: hypothetical protein A3J76_03895 [Candidatus Moranbacteria bacterium RBG_13_45_13]
MNFFVKTSMTVAIMLITSSLAFAQGDAKKKAYYFYGEQCPHCKNVDEHFKSNGIYNKYEIQKLEVSNPFNQKLFVSFGEAFAQSDWGGVPTIIFGDKYLVGDKPIIENFTREIDAAENASDLPDPEKIGGTEKVNTENQESQQENQNESGNKKNYFPVVMVALVAIGAGALLYVNRKKTNE